MLFRSRHRTKSFSYRSHFVVFSHQPLMSILFPISRDSSTNDSRKEITMATLQLKPTPVSTDVSPVHSSLTPNGTAAIGSNLRRLISGVFTLYIKTKGIHRHRRMPNFRDYFRSLDRSNGSEKLLQEHVIAISLGLYIEIALGPLLGSLVVYLHSHWMT